MADALYIHIPYCLRKCAYCDFYSVPLDHGASQDYVKSLLLEMALRKESARDLKTVYIGGGTPTVLSDNAAAEIMRGVRDFFSIRDDAEVTIEANPGTLSESKALSLRAAGINRISIGIQSLSDAELGILGRIHSSAEARNAVASVRGAGFGNVSLDLMCGIPGQDAASWEATLLGAIKLSPEHISAYELTLEEGTPLYSAVHEGRLTLPDEETVTAMYYRCIDLLKEHGYEQYEISNYARPGREARHNMNYWRRGEYLGIGAGAHSFLSGRRMANIRDLRRYSELLDKGIVPVVEEPPLMPADLSREMLFLGLRTREGIDSHDLPEGETLMKSKTVEELLLHGLLELDGGRLRLSRKGLVLSNEIFLRLFDAL